MCADRGKVVSETAKRIATIRSAHFPKDELLLDESYNFFFFCKNNKKQCLCKFIIRNFMILNFPHFFTLKHNLTFFFLNIISKLLQLRYEFEFPAFFLR